MIHNNFPSTLLTRHLRLGIIIQADFFSNRSVLPGSRPCSLRTYQRSGRTERQTPSNRLSSLRQTYGGVACGILSGQHTPAGHRPVHRIYSKRLSPYSWFRLSGTTAPRLGLHLDAEFCGLCLATCPLTFRRRSGLAPAGHTEGTLGCSHTRV